MESETMNGKLTEEEIDQELKHYPRPFGINRAGDIMRQLRVERDEARAQLSALHSAADEGKKDSDEQILNWLASHWDSQKLGRQAIGFVLENETGSFRDACRAAMSASPAAGTGKDTNH